MPPSQLPSVSSSPELLDFLQSELAVSEAGIRLGLRHVDGNPTLLPMALWQYGLVTMAELNQILDWLEQRPIAALMT